MIGNIFVLFLFVQIKLILVQGQEAYKVDLQQAVKDKALHGYAFLNLTQTPIINCFTSCVKHCRCTAFQICHNTECQLLSSNRFLSPSVFYRNHGCTYYDLSPRQCNDGSCMTVANCCKTSNTCLNGGTCLLSSPNARKRFRCNCSNGYTGERCEHPIRSCRGYSNGRRMPGNYTVIDVDNKPFIVFCDFDGNSNMTWTLIQSYSFQNNVIFRNSPLCKNVPQNHKSPSWLKYRLLKSRMQSVQQDSKKWRLTCRYDTDGVVYTDYVRALNSKFDILSSVKINGQCVQVEYIDIRGYHCTNCTSPMWQTKSGILHIDSYKANIKSGCEFKPAESTSCGEDNFGHYNCFNPRHRCTSSEQATTQTWFGCE